MLQRRKRMIMTSVKLRTIGAKAQKHECESSCSSHVVYFIFSHACTEITTFLPKTREENPLFGIHTKCAEVIYELFSSVRRFNRNNFAPIVGFHNDEVGCPYIQVFTTNLLFGPLDGDTWWCKK